MKKDLTMINHICEELHFLKKENKDHFSSLRILLHVLITFILPFHIVAQNGIIPLSKGGDFEYPNIQFEMGAAENSLQFEDSEVDYLSHVSSLNGWNIVAGNIDLLRDWINHAQGKQSIDLYGTTHGAIQQTIDNLIPGEQYTIVFQYAGYTKGDAAVLTLEHGKSSPVTYKIINPTSAKSNPYAGIKNHSVTVQWHTFTTTFTAFSSTAKVAFRNTKSIRLSSGIYLDNFSLTGPTSSPSPLVASKK